MDESVLNTIKKMLGLAEDYDAFDIDVIVAINSALMVLGQIGAIPVGKHITGSNETWRNVMGDRTDLDSLWLYVYLRVKLVFDPPTTGSLMEAYAKRADELEWRLNVQADT